LKAAVKQEWRRIFEAEDSDVDTLTIPIGPNCRTARVSPAKSVKTIRSGITVFGQSNELFTKAARAVEKGIVFPEMMVIGNDEATGFVVLEGHLRLTAYLLSEKNSPEKYEHSLASRITSRGGWPQVMAEAST
jgi:hypothetical protein